MTPTRLLAKSSTNPEAPNKAETLPGHTARVLAAARRIVANVGERALHAIGLDRNHWLPRLDFAVAFAAAMHDLGKASDQFQAVVRRRLEHPQSARHEAITGLLMLGSLREPLFVRACERDELAAWSALVAACGHHRKFPNGRGRFLVQPAPNNLTVHTDHRDFRDTCAIIAKLLESTVPEVAPPSWSTGTRGELEEVLRELLEAADDDFERVSEPAEAKRFAALVRGLLFGADAAGSALHREGVKISGWIDDALGERLTRPDLDAIVDRKLAGNCLRPFQANVERSQGRVTLVTAGCGTGKTAAAYAWARNHAAGRKLVFCYPTTGTTSEGFRSYVLDSGVPSALVHGRSAIDLEDMTSNGHDDDVQQDSIVRLDSLRTWGARVTVCTVDTVLGALMFNRAGLYAFPALCDSAFVFDEVHAYDPHMFAVLLEFLRLFPHVPVLLMTASMPDSRKRALRQVIPQLTEIPGPEELEELSRYVVMPGPSPEPPWTIIDEVLHAGGKVLWVSNTVSRAIERANQWEERDAAHSAASFVYHSRFRYEDRVARHAEVMRAFDKRAGAAIAFTTQVCEMSLDISANLLLTDCAPPAALVQRLGRLNRHATPEAPGEPMPAYCLEVPSLAPYRANEMNSGATFWCGLAEGNGTRSQVDLNRALLANALDEELSEVSVNLRDSARSIPEAVREAGVISVDVLRQEDLRRVTAEPRDILRCVIPIPYRAEINRWPNRFRGFPVAPERAFVYDARFGLQED